jgi:hypothetical protein
LAVGPTASGKTLGCAIVADNMKGKYSPKRLYSSFRALHPFRYQRVILFIYFYNFLIILILIYFLLLFFVVHLNIYFSLRFNLDTNAVNIPLLQRYALYLQLHIYMKYLLFLKYNLKRQNCNHIFLFITVFYIFIFYFLS